MKQLHETARRLGQGAADRLDVERIAADVLSRLRQQPAPRAIWIRSTWLRIAAALVIVVSGGLFMRSRVPSPQSPVPPLIADDLRDLSNDELRALLASFDQIIDESAADSTSDLQELDAQELRELLREG